MRISVPQEIKNARQVENERDAILAAAEAQAEAMVEAGREKVQQMAAEHEIAREANERAELILNESYNQAAQIRADADEYALEVLERIQAQIDAFSRTVSNGIRVLRGDGRNRRRGSDEGQERLEEAPDREEAVPPTG